MRQATDNTASNTATIQTWQRSLAVSILLVFVVPTSSWSEEKPRPANRIEPAGITGSLVIVGGGTVPVEARERFLKLAGAEKARIVVIPTATDAADLASGSSWLKALEVPSVTSVVVIHATSHEDADRAAVAEPLRQATGLWFDATGFDETAPTRIATTYAGTSVAREIAALLQRGGVVGGNWAATSALGESIVSNSQAGPNLQPGLGLLPGSAIEAHLMKRNQKSGLAALLEQRPELFGLGVDEETAAIVRGRTIEVIGAGNVTISLNRSSSGPAREIVFKSGEETDLTRWRFAARARTAAAFPPTQPEEPRVPQGSLVIVGGGGVPPDVLQRFIDLAGGPQAKFVILPTANPQPKQLALRDGRFLEQAGCQHVTVLPGSSLAEVTSPEFLATLKAANGIWFGGGRQWRFVDAYAETPAVEAFRDVLRRGGVIGGSSAGATIQGDYLVRGSPQGNEEMMAEGYERGFAFLPGVAIDQHFTQRKRQADLLSVMATHPQLLGIGLDESTAIVVQGTSAEVCGQNQAHFYNTRVPTTAGGPTCVSLTAGARFDLVKREAIDPPPAKPVDKP